MCKGRIYCAPIVYALYRGISPCSIYNRFPIRRCSEKRAGLRAAEDIFNQIYIALIYTRDNRSIPAPTYAIYTTVRLLIIFLAFIFNRNISPLDTRNDGTDNDFCGIYLITCCGNGRILIIHIFIISRDLIIGIRLDRRDIDITSGKYGSVLIHIVHLLLQEYLKILYFGYTSLLQ